jgi:hypothetical protein
LLARSLDRPADTSLALAERIRLLTEKRGNTSREETEVNPHFRARALASAREGPMRPLVGLLLLPFCCAATRSLAELLQAIQPESYRVIPYSTWGLALGFSVWLLFFFCLPRPVRTYVLAHELTHALWGWVMGAEIKRLRVGRGGGSVVLTRNNFLITLAPYFFPLYTMLVLAAYGLLSLFRDLRPYEPLWMSLIGLTWAFHLTFTIATLIQHQADIRENGRLFSYAVIYLFNVLGIGLWIVLVGSPTLEAYSRAVFGESIRAWRVVGAAGGWIARRLASLRPAGG